MKCEYCAGKGRKLIHGDWITCGYCLGSGTVVLAELVYRYKCPKCDTAVYRPKAKSKNIKCDACGCEIVIVYEGEN